MERAFDTIMQRAVYARDVAKCSIDEYFRFTENRTNEMFNQ